MTWWVGLTGFDWKSTVQNDGRCVSTYIEEYLVRTDAATLQGPAAVITALGIARGSAYALDANAICNDVHVTPGPVMTRPPYLAYSVTAQWASNAVLPEDDDDDPTTTRTIWSIAPQIQSRYEIEDRAGDLIVTTAGNPFDGGIPIDVRLGTVTARRNKDATGYDKSAVLANSGKLNLTTYLGGAAGTVQVDISAEEHYEGAFHWWSETYTFAYDPKGWQPKPASADFFQRDAVGSDTLVRIINSDIGDTNAPNDPVQEPQPLDTDGILVPIADRPANCAFVTVDKFETMDFSTFGL